MEQRRADLVARMRSTADAENRDLQPQLEETEKMLTEVDVTKFASYRWGMRDGLQQGRKQGLQQGELKKTQDIARQLLQLSVIPEAEVLRITGLNMEQLAALRPQH